MAGERVDALICGDDPVSLQFLEAMLKADDYKVEALTHVSEAVRSCLRRRYRLIIFSLTQFDWRETDERLESLRVIREIAPMIPLIVVSDQESLQLERKLRAEGIFYFLTGPVSAQELRAVVDCAINKQKRESME